jgi:adenosine deaminase
VQVTNDTPDFLGFEKFELLRRFYRTPEAIARLAYEAVADAAADNVSTSSCASIPRRWPTPGASPEAVTDWVIDAVARAQTDRASWCG